MQNNFIRLFTVLIFCVCTLIAFGQKPYPRQLVNVTPAEALKAAADFYDTPILFSDDFFGDAALVSIDFTSLKLEEALQQLLNNQSLTFFQKNGMILVKRVSDTVLLHGYIKAVDGGENLPYASILIDGVIPVVANEEGYYQVKMKKGSHRLKASFIAHRDTMVQRSFEKNQQYDFFLNTSNIIEEVIVEKSTAIEEVRAVNNQSHNDLMRLSLMTPDMGGTSDLLNSARLLPGVQSGAGGIGGHFVRGGGNGNNLYLLDGVPIYNPYHVLGLTSVFNPVITKSFQVKKSGFEAAYGDVTSAIFDIKLKDGSTKKLSGDFSVNTNDLSGVLEIPIVKNRVGLMIYGRKDIAGFYYDRVIDDALNPVGEGGVDLELGENLQKNYHDLFVKAHTKIGQRHLLSFNYYRSKDDISVKEDYDLIEGENQLEWGNDIYSLKWNFILGDNMFLKTNASYNIYYSSFKELEEFDLPGEESFFYFENSSSNEALSLNTKLDVLWNEKNRSVFTAGIQETQYTPINQFVNDDSISVVFDSLDIDDFDGFGIVETYRTRKYVASIDHTFDWNRLVVKAGLRGVLFQNVDYYNLSLQPRLSIDYQLARRHFLHLHYANTRQYDHLIGGSALLLPQDYWVPADDSFQPEFGNVIDLGYTFYGNRKDYFSANLYWKKEDNKVYANPLDDGDFEGVYTGEGESYGLELSFNKTYGKLTYKLAYSIGKTTRRFDGLNLSEKFPFQFDRRQELKALGSYTFFTNLTLGANLYLGAGHPRLDAVDGNLSTGIVAVNYASPGQRNLNRDDINFRLDLSLAYQHQFKNTHHQIKASVFNIFNTKRPLYYLRTTPEDPGQPQLSLPFLPSVSYRISF